ncbi:MAG: hypothetical protein DI628_02550 [Blastochloris viridis]|uniref:Uncharacterized protein n=1 Tax=Blastochloris viridis TaxID=1079 RepID=A0A6N4R8Q1_BLAVI|nr:MAG: hypothetical protein DI628_02550 [Blastochloris viridis]
MPQTVTLEDYAYDIERRALADPDAWTETMFLSSRITDAPTDREGLRALRKEFLEELHKLQPEWLFVCLEDAPQMAQSPMARTTPQDDLWKWIHIRKRADVN